MVSNSLKSYVFLMVNFALLNLSSTPEESPCDLNEFSSSNSCLRVRTRIYNPVVFGGLHGAQLFDNGLVPDAAINREAVKHHSPGSRSTPREHWPQHMKTPKGFSNPSEGLRTRLCNPLGLANGSFQYPGCVARPRALLLNASGVVNV